MVKAVGFRVSLRGFTMLFYSIGAEKHRFATYSMALAVSGSFLCKSKGEGKKDQQGLREHQENEADQKK